MSLTAGYAGALSHLKPETLVRLRAIVKRVHMRHYPADLITDREADRIIDVMAPETLETVQRKAIERKIV
jgi:hypothetical protein